MDRLSFDDVLGTNYAPSYNESISIKTLVESMEQELSSLNQVLLPLLARRDKLNGSIAAHKALLTPARRLLPELLSEIFTHAIHRDSEFLESEWCSSGRTRSLLARPCVSEAPLKLGRICRRWRQIALSTPLLWSSFDIPNTWSVEGLQEWIGRAGMSSLSFNVEIHQRNLELSKLLASYQKRWKHVVLLFQTGQAGRQLFREFLESLSCSYGNLQTLEIRCTSQEWSHPPNQPNNIKLNLSLDSALDLRSLILHAPNFKIITLNTLPFLYLREINVMSDPTTAADFLTLLRLAPTVEVIYAYILPIPDISDSRHGFLNLANLKHLVISEYDRDGDRFCLLGKLDLPALEQLWFSNTYDWENTRRCPPTHAIRSLIYRSRPPLTVLRVHGFCVPAADVMYCLPFLPNLSCLYIEYVGASDNWDGIVQSLTGPIPPSDENLSSCMCAQLTEICFGPDRHVTPDLVIKMILSRSPVGNQKLSCVTVLSCSERDVLTHPKITDCVANGLKFVASDTNPWGGRSWEADSP